jgi:Bax protein
MKTVLAIQLLLFCSSFSGFPQTSNPKYIEIEGSAIEDIKIVTELVDAYVYKTAIDLTDLEPNNKKKLFVNLMLPSILIAKFKLEQTRISVVALVNSESAISPKDEEYLAQLRKSYKCATNKELIARLHTHPTSIVIAQAALESGWGTSRFYKQANNIFGVWSYSKNEARIKASEDRDGTAIYVKKYESLPESIASYFKTLARGPYKTFRAERVRTKDVYQLIPHLKVYSELRD